MLSGLIPGLAGGGGVSDAPALLLVRVVILIAKGTDRMLDSSMVIERNASVTSVFVLAQSRGLR